MELIKVLEDDELTIEADSDDVGDTTILRATAGGRCVEFTGESLREVKNVAMAIGPELAVSMALSENLQERFEKLGGFTVLS